MPLQPLSFGALTSQNVSWPTMVEPWQRLEALGFNHAWLGDHFSHRADATEPWLEAWTLLAGLAACTSRIQLGTLVTTITYHNPAVLAKQAVAVDHLSAGAWNWGWGRAARRRTTP